MSKNTKNFVLFVVMALALAFVSESLKLSMNDWRYWALIFIVFISFNYGRELKNES